MAARVRFRQRQRGTTSLIKIGDRKASLKTAMVAVAAVALALLVEPFSHVTDALAIAQMAVAILLGAAAIGISTREWVSAASLAAAATIVYLNKALLNRSLISFFDIAIWSLEDLIGRYAATVALVVLLAVIIRLVVKSRRRIWLAGLVLLLIFLSIPVPWPDTV